MWARRSSGRPVRLELEYVTRYRYDPAAGRGLTALRVRPRSRPGLRVISTALSATPGIATLSYRDGWGTEVDLLEYPRIHTEATFSMRALVETEQIERAEQLAPDESLLFRLPSSRVVPSAVEELGWSIGGEGLSWSAVESVLAWVPQRFVYRVGATTAQTSVHEVLEQGVGVCQDFAHVLLSILRGWGWAARYVSGYVFSGPPGSDRIEAEAMHAWVDVFRPGHGWIGMDPTTGRYADDRYVVVAHGRDYDDVRPVRGVLTGPRNQEQDARLVITAAAAQSQQ